MGLRKPGPGRPRKLGGQARPTTREGQGRTNQDREPLLARLRLAGVMLPPFFTKRGDVRPPSLEEIRNLARRHELLDLEMASPLAVLLREGKLVDLDAGDEPGFGVARAAAAARYARLHALHYGRASVQAQTFGYQAPLNEQEVATLARRAGNSEVIAYTPLQQAWIVEQMVQRMQNALARQGRHVVSIVNAVVIYGHAPKQGQLTPLRQGLARLCTVQPVEASDVPNIKDVA